MKKSRKIARRMLEYLLGNRDDRTKLLSTAVRVHKCPSHDQLIHSDVSERKDIPADQDGRGNLAMEGSQSEKGQIQKRNEAENAEASSAFSVFQPVGCIEYLGTDGTPAETVKYTDAKQFLQDVKRETFYGAPFTVILYRNKQGYTIPQDFWRELDPPPKGFRVENVLICDGEQSRRSSERKEVKHQKERRKELER